MRMFVSIPVVIPWCFPLSKTSSSVWSESISSSNVVIFRLPLCTLVTMPTMLCELFDDATFAPCGPVIELIPMFSCTAVPKAASEMATPMGCGSSIVPMESSPMKVECPSTGRWLWLVVIVLWKDEDVDTLPSIELVDVEEDEDNDEDDEDEPDKGIDTERMKQVLFECIFLFYLLFN